MENRSKVPFFILDTIFIQLLKMGKNILVTLTMSSKKTNPQRALILLLAN